MALVSPGVEVSIIDESIYVPAATNSVPYVLVATAQNKVSGTGSGVAVGTLAANAGRVFLITSQRNLAQTFGNPFFYKTAAGTPINGYELNEYGLLAASSVLGISNRAYVQRADVNLSELVASLVRPVGAPSNNAHWLDTDDSTWGIFQWNQTTGAFTNKVPLVLTESTQVTGGSVPLASIGSIGDYAVVALNVNTPTYYKNNSNAWVLVGSDAWKRSWPTLQGTQSVTASLTAGQGIIINGTTVAVPASPNNTVTGLVNAINTAAITGITAEVDTSSRFVIYADSQAVSDDSSGGGGIVTISSSSTAALLTALGITANSYYAPALQQSYNYVVPRWRSTDVAPRPTGSVWNMVTAVNLGADIVVKRYDTTLAAFIIENTPIYANDWSALQGLDPAGGGRNIDAGSLYIQFNSSPEEVASPAPFANEYNNTMTFQVFERLEAGPTRASGVNTDPTFTSGSTFTIQASVANSASLTPVVPAIATVNGTTAADFAAAVSAAAVPNVSAQVNSDGSITLVHAQGGVIIVNNTSTGGVNPLSDAGFTSVDGADTIRAGTGEYTGALIISNWVQLEYTASNTGPDQNPANGRLWYYSAVNQVDIMIQSGSGWQGYRNVSLDVRGFNLTQTDSSGPQISPTEPLTQSDGTDLVYGDLWIDTANLELYPVIKRWDQVDGIDQWVTLDNTDQTTSNGVLFADARWAPNGTTDPITDNIPTIQSLLTSNYLDLDAPDPSLYPTGMLLFNTRRSGYNVKSFQDNYFNPQNPNITVSGYESGVNYVVGNKVLYNGIIYVAIANSIGEAPSDPTYWSVLETNAWVTASGNRNNGSPYMGRLAVRQLVVAAMKRTIDTSDTLREEQLNFNLIATPGYPELIINMIALNNERNNTAFVVGDTPMRLPPDGNDIVAWATDSGGLGFPSGDGLSTSNAYLGVFYPSCQTTDLSGSAVVQPPSHMMLRTIVRNDEVAFPWLAPAGVRRGVIDNASLIGYINAATGEFETIATGQGLRDVLYINKINPITFIPGVGITNYGNKTEASVPSALDRINVARLVAYIRGRLQEIAKTFVFEPNDEITRNELANAIDGLFQDIQSKRGLYDYTIVCDLSNNTPTTIDRNELYVDIAIEPVKAVEFIYIPVRIVNTGELSGGGGAA